MSGLNEIDPADATLGDVSWALKAALTPLTEAIGGRGAPGHDAAGGTVDSLTEAVMGVTAGLCRIADAIEAHTAAMEDSRFMSDVVDGHTKATNSIASAINSLAEAVRRK